MRVPASMIRLPRKPSSFDRPHCPEVVVKRGVQVTPAADLDVAKRAQKTSAPVATHHRAFLRMIETTRFAFGEHGRRHCRHFRPGQRRENANPQSRFARWARNKVVQVKKIRGKPRLASRAGNARLDHAFKRITRVSQMRSCNERFSSSNAAMM